MSERTAFVLVVSDDHHAANALLGTMHISWERDGSWHRRQGLRVKWIIPGRKAAPEAASNASSDDIRIAAASEESGLSEFDTTREFVATTDVRRGYLRLQIDARHPRIRVGAGMPSSCDVAVHLRHILPHFFADQRPGPDRLVELIETELVSFKAEHERNPDDIILLGITDVALDGHFDPRFGSGIDQVMTPGLTSRLADTLPLRPRVAVAITGFEREFARFDVEDPRWSRFRNASEAAWDPSVIRQMLQLTLSQRPHLVNLLQNDERFRGPRSPMTVSAAIPCGFLNDWRCVNYNACEPGPLHGGSSIRDEKEWPHVVPHHCADPLLTALTGMQTDFQITLRQLAPRRRGFQQGRAQNFSSGG